MSEIYPIRESTIEASRQFEASVHAVPETLFHPLTNKTDNTNQTIDGRVQSIDKKKLAEITDQLNQITKIFKHNIEFFIDDKLNKVVVKIINSVTGEVVRQIPPEKMLNLMRSIDQMLGLILDEKI